MKPPGKTSEFTRFYEATKTPVFRAVLLARAGDRRDSEDAVAEAYARAYLRWDRLSTHPNPVGWVIRAAINQRVSMWRRHRGEVLGPVEGGAAPPDEGVDPKLLQLIRRLPKGQREVLALRILFDYSTEQTADALGIKHGTVKKQLHRALQTLRGELECFDALEVWQ